MATGELPPDLAAELRAYVDREVRGGFTPVGEIPNAAAEYLATDADAATLRSHAEAYTAEALVAHAEAQKQWTTTDCDRLDASFAQLEADGILARQDFSCCQNCGHGEMWDLVQSAQADNHRVRGYAFYHHQDTESAVEGSGLHLAYGSATEGDDALARIGHEIVAALRSNGLHVNWDGTTKKRILVTVDWKRRRD
jgi:hypothetical protein